MNVHIQVKIAVNMKQCLGTVALCISIRKVPSMNLDQIISSPYLFVFLSVVPRDFRIGTPFSYLFNIHEQIYFPNILR
jgi:hypothetical protein